MCCGLLGRTTTRSVSRSVRTDGERKKGGAGDEPIDQLPTTAPHVAVHLVDRCRGSVGVTPRVPDFGHARAVAPCDASAGHAVVLVCHRWGKLVLVPSGVPVATTTRAPA